MLKLQPAIIGLAICIASLVPALEAQQNSPSAPKPEQILTAKKIFVSNAAEPCSSLFCSAPDQPYNDLYNGIKTLGRYDVVATPADADLVFEINSVYYPTIQPLQLKLVILDPKTRITLWTLEEQVDVAARQSARARNFDKAMSSLIRDIQRLTLPAAPPPNKGK
jgi:hypothetical protein